MKISTNPRHLCMVCASFADGGKESLFFCQWCSLLTDSLQSFGDLFGFHNLCSKANS